VIVWDGGNNDVPFFAPDLHICVADALRPGHELRYHPGETNLRMADVVVINKVDSAEPAAVAAVAANVAATNPGAIVIRAASPVTLEPGPSLAGARVLVVEDGPTLTHGGMPYGAGTVAARQAGAASFVDPRPHAVGSIAETFRAYPGIGLVLPAMGYSQRQTEELAATIDAADCDVVVTGTPIDLRRILGTARPIRHARYELRELGHPDLADVLAPILAAATSGRPAATAR
jgi:predicted GTPase